MALALANSAVPLGRQNLNWVTWP